MNGDKAGGNSRSHRKARGGPSGQDVIEIARKLWGDENRQQSNLRQVVWDDGHTLDLETGLWTDRRAKKAGTLAELYLMAGVPFPRLADDPALKTVVDMAWLEEAQFSRAEPIGNVANVCLAFRNDLDFRDAFAFDEMQRRPVLVRPIRDLPLGMIDDRGYDIVQEILQLKGLRRVGIEAIMAAMLIVSHEHSFHPVRAYLEGLSWDGQDRLERWLADYLGCANDDYHAVIGTCFLISMVGRIMNPGCKADYMLVLEGPQGTLKSTAVAILAGDYYSDALPDLAGDPIRVSQHLRGKWVIEVSELSAFGRAEHHRLKAFVTQQVEKYLPKFGRVEVNEPRQFVLVGTTNSDTWLRDDTGGRRFWPAKCGQILIEALMRDRDQLLAEAMHRFKEGEHAYPDPDFEQKHIKPIQDARYEADAWEIAIEIYYRDFPTTGATLLMIANNALKMDTNKLGVADQRRIVACLNRLGWVRGSRQSFGWTWKPPSKLLI